MIALDQEGQGWSWAEPMALETEKRPNSRCKAGDQVHVRERRLMADERCIEMSCLKILHTETSPNQ
jgi:hypothetical protein